VGRRRGPDESLRTLRPHRREDPTDQEIGVELSEPDDPEEDLLQERRVALARALAALPERHRKLMEALLAEDAPCYAAIAAELGIPIGSIGPIRGRCIERLRRELAPESA
jgi:DNA-directed RNA polymerase specialized sigma24 family protein